MTVSSPFPNATDLVGMVRVSGADADAAMVTEDEAVVTDVAGVVVVKAEVTSVTAEPDVAENRREFVAFVHRLVGRQKSVLTLDGDGGGVEAD